jgi:zinc transporter, ZIP family
MLEAAAWGLVGASSLLIGAVIGLRLPAVTRGRRAKRVNLALGLILGFGAGTLISAVAFELTEEAYRLGGADAVAGGLAAGALAYFAGNLAISTRGGGDRMRPDDRSGSETSSALLLGAVLDGVPESAVLGITLLETGTIGVPILAAVFISNLPEALSSSTGMRRQGLRPGHILLTWGLVCAVSAVSAALGYGLLENASGNLVGWIQAFAGGAVLTMLATTMFPTANTLEKKVGPVAQGAIGLATVLGFSLAYLLSTLE